MYIGIDDCLVICQECLEFVLNVKQFAMRVAKVKKMFLQLLSGQSDGKDDIERRTYGLAENSEQANSVIEDPQLTYVNFLKIEPVEECSDTESEKLDFLNVKNESIYIDVDTVCEYNENMDISVDIEDVADDHLHEEDFGHDNADGNLSCNQELHSIVERANANKASPTKSIKSARDLKHDNMNTNCTVCDKTLLTYGLYKRHMRTKHPTTVQNFVCKKCQKSFVSKKNLLQHESVHLPDHLKKTIPCPYCKKKFRTTRTVTIHIGFVHSSERPYVCEECGKSFATSGCLTQHRITHVKERDWQCSQCPKKFKNLAHLKKHIDIHNEDAHVCPDCGKQLNTKRNLRVHMLVHSDQKNYKCQFCDFEFKRAYNLKVSRRTQTLVVLAFYFTILPETLRSTLGYETICVFFLRENFYTWNKAARSRENLSSRGICGPQKSRNR